MSEVQRYEALRLDKVSEAPTGIRVDATITSVGVFPYLDSFGKVRYEYRPPEEVFHPESLKSLRDAPVVLGHPPGLLTPKQWKQYAIGHVSGEPKVDADTGQVVSELVIAEGQAIERTLRRDLQELSGGYRCKVIPRSGVTPEGIPGVEPGVRYDAVQTQIRYNHVGFGGAGWGRQGERASVRLDSKGNQIFEEKEETVEKLKLRLDGKDIEVEPGSAEHLQVQARLESVAAELADLRKKVDTITAERDALQSTARDLQVKLDAAPQAIAAQLKARSDLESRAAKILGKEYRFDDKTDDQIRVAVIAARDTAFRADGKSSDYLAASFDYYTREADAATAQRNAAILSLNPESRSSLADTRLDESNPNAELARERFLARSREFHKLPLNGTRK